MAEGKESPKVLLLFALGVLVVIGTFSKGSNTDGQPSSQQPAPVAQTTPSAPSSLMVMSMAETRVRDALRDPSGAEFRNKHVPAGKGYLCGEVNGSNGFGGRAGFQRFIAGASSKMPVALEESMSPAEFDAAWNKLC